MGRYTKDKPFSGFLEQFTQGVGQLTPRVLGKLASAFAAKMMFEWQQVVAGTLDRKTAHAGHLPINA